MRNPAYTTSCREILGAHGITILDRLYGFLEVDSNLVVMSVFPNVPVKAIVTELVRPALIIWDKGRPEEPITEIETFIDEDGQSVWLMLEFLLV